MSPRALLLQYDRQLETWMTALGGTGSGAARRARTLAPALPPEALAAVDRLSELAGRVRVDGAVPSAGELAQGDLDFTLLEVQLQRRLAAKSVAGGAVEARMQERARTGALERELARNRQAYSAPVTPRRAAPLPRRERPVVVRQGQAPGLPAHFTAPPAPTRGPARVLWLVLETAVMAVLLLILLR